MFPVEVVGVLLNGLFITEVWRELPVDVVRIRPAGLMGNVMVQQAQVIICKHKNESFDVTHQPNRSHTIHPQYTPTTPTGTPATNKQ